jgi:hypothetical protein
MILQLLDPNQCATCLSNAIAKDWGEFLVCSVTILVGYIVRKWEKKKIEKKRRCLLKLLKIT